MCRKKPDSASSDQVEQIGNTTGNLLAPQSRKVERNQRSIAIDQLTHLVWRDRIVNVSGAEHDQAPEGREKLEAFGSDLARGSFEHHVRAFTVQGGADSIQPPLHAVIDRRVHL